MQVLNRPALSSAHALLFHRFLLRLALAGTNIFAWIFVFQYFYLVEHDLAHALARVALLYALSQTITCLLTPYSARSLRQGVRRVLLFATLVASAAFVILGATFQGFWGSASVPGAIAFFAIALGVYRALYWVPYQVEAAAEHDGGRRSILGELFIALLPAAGGLFIAFDTMAPIWLLYLGALVMMLSIIPLFYLHDMYERFSWGYRQTYHELLEPSHRTMVVDAFLEGISGTALIFFWPLAVFLIIGWSYGMLGIILSFTFIVAILARTLVRKLVRRARLQESIALNVALAISPWLFRLVVATPLGVVLVDSYFYTTTPRRLGVDPFIFEQVADGGSFIDEQTALKEIALSLGRIAACILGAVVALSVSVSIALVAVFLVAALSSAVATFRSVR